MNQLQYQYRVIFSLYHNADKGEYFTLQLVNEYDGYDNSKDPSDMKCLGNTQRVFALKYHPEYNDIFLTGGWDNHVKVGGTNP